jgi:alcohol dehydrogenase
MCANRLLTGVDGDGGLAEYSIARVTSLVRLPHELPLSDAAPLLCAGAAAFATLRATELSPGERIAIQGIGRLGHILIQAASGMGLDVVAISRGATKRELAAGLGARAYLDASTQDPVESLMAMGGVPAIVCTSPDAQTICELISGLQPGGKLVLLTGASVPLQIRPVELIGGRKMVSGILNCTPAEVELALRYFCVAQVKAQTHFFEFEDVAAAFSAVLTRVDHRSIVVKVAADAHLV